MKPRALGIDVGAASPDRAAVCAPRLRPSCAGLAPTQSVPHGFPLGEGPGGPSFAGEVSAPVGSTIAGAAAVAAAATG
eukprot:CAMPEP_0117591342 /NCGR_PEP_ID=MMETSP0784-20121206/71478_1 /TAXON_ID=39447 /ORGANISM="" /LENGTH=77 /DNA_ID=CAMNT_0005393051 /DNA_START=6 /DNA_END=235 /DNA_ORIENTATION=-